MSENYIVINGKKAELTAEQIKTLGIEEKKDNPFDIKEGESYYYIDFMGRLDTSTCLCSDRKRNNMAVANACKDKVMIEHRVKIETLNRLLWRYSMEHDGDKIDWDDLHTEKWYILYDYNEEHWIVQENMCCRSIGIVYFYSRKIAEDALKEIVKPFVKENFTESFC